MIWMPPSLSLPMPPHERCLSTSTSDTEVWRKLVQLYHRLPPLYMPLLPGDIVVSSTCLTQPIIYAMNFFLGIKDGRCDIDDITKRVSIIYFKHKWLSLYSQYNAWCENVYLILLWLTWYTLYICDRASYGQVVIYTACIRFCLDPCVNECWHLSLPGSDLIVNRSLSVQVYDRQTEEYKGREKNNDRLIIH